MKRILNFSIIFFGLIVILNACARPPLDRVTQENFPHFSDDLQLDGLLTGAVRHLHYLNSLPDDSSFTLGTDIYPVSWLRESMNTFIDILKQDPDTDELARIIAENFSIYQAGGRKDLPRGEMLITGYYEPFFKGSLTLEAPYIFPIYAPPESLIQTRDTETGKMRFKRKDQHGSLVPYWTRKEIDTSKHAAGNELVYLDNPVDAFILHVQGSGRIQLQDGTIRSIHYAASNGLEYFSIGKLLVDSGKLSLEEVSIPSIRKYLHEHPVEQQEILNHNIKYIFFNWAPDGDPVGSIGEPLVGGRSIAVDPDNLPQTTLAFLISRKPVLDETGAITSWVPMQRFVFPQDSGSAIKGSGRADLYWGSGSYAKAAAGNMKEEGSLYFMVKNKFEELRK
jgi:membrane-bound lytic murein transglycosylase A